MECYVFNYFSHSCDTYNCSRTGKNVLEGKTIRTNALGIQNFADYFSSG